MCDFFSIKKCQNFCKSLLINCDWVVTKPQIIFCSYVNKGAFDFRNWILKALLPFKWTVHEDNATYIKKAHL